jgi:hypothetical protein
MNHIETEPDKERALDILERAFFNVPGVMWLLKKSGDKKKLLRMLLSSCLYESALKKGAYLTNDRNGVVLFYKLDCKPASLMILLNKLYLLIEVTGIKHGIQAIRSREIIGRVRPKTGWYGWFLATDRDATGNAAAFEIKREIFKLSDMSNEPIYVETTMERIMLLYKRMGFYQYAKIRHPYENFDIWFMKRDPHTNN